jgi:UPF0716 protein FxsA
MRVLLALAALVIAELAAFVAVESRIGFGNTLLITLVAAVVGLSLVRRAGAGVIGELRRRMGIGEVPARELTHGAVVLSAGLMLILPGFVTDALGFLLLVPAVRDLAHRGITRRLTGRVTLIGPAHTSGPRVSRGGPPDEESEIIDVESWEEL